MHVYTALYKAHDVHLFNPLNVPSEVNPITFFHYTDGKTKVGTERQSDIPEVTRLTGHINS